MISPPVPLFRSLDVRTASEIAEERYALKVLQSDFQDGPTATPRPTSIAFSRPCVTEEADDRLMDSRGADRHERRSA